jgi:predicted ATPase
VAFWRRVKVWDKQEIKTMITRVKVKYFKSFEDFELANIGSFTCLIGLNGSGKTTLLQFFDFIRAMLDGRIEDWFSKHRWKPQDIITFASPKRSVEFEIDVSSEGVTQRWKAFFNIQELRCTSEVLLEIRNDREERLMSFSENKLSLSEGGVTLPKGFKYTGSMLSYVGRSWPLVQRLKEIKIFGVLNPESISQASKVSSNIREVDVASDGGGLVGFLSKLDAASQEDFVKKLRDFYPSLRNYRIRKQRFGWKNLLLNELEKAVFFDSSHLSYGTLRLFVFLSQLYSKNKCIFFDEIENGMNQELIGKLVDILQNFDGKQVFVTTHSALLLNYLSDQAARKSVVMFYKDSNGYTHAKKFFELPAMEKELEFLGAGQVMSKTNLLELADSLAKKTDPQREE